MIKKIISICLCILLIALTISGCSSGSEKLDMIYPFDGAINSYDPQVAATQDEFLIAENCFEGLVRTMDDGAVKPGVATDWSISDDGKTYTFHLRQGAKWHISDSVVEMMGEDWNPDITAHDFLFALRRSASSETGSSLFSLISNIVNAPSINAGKKSVSTLGVKAINDYTLEIRLTASDDSFLNSLSTAVCMPCNEAFFNRTGGRYGLGTVYAISNGQFYVKSQLESSFILKKNEEYVGESPAKITDLTLNVMSEERKQKLVKNIKDGYYDAAYISGSEYEELEGQNGITATPYSNTTWSLLINNLVLPDAKMRKALCLGLSKTDLSGNKYLSNATGVTPPSCMIGNKTVSGLKNDLTLKQDIESAKALWREGLKTTGLTQIDLTLITTEEMNPYAKKLVQGIQSSIGKITSYGNSSTVSFSLKIETLSLEELTLTVKKGEYDLALYPMEATQGPVAFLSKIAEENLPRSSSKEFEKTLSKAKSASANAAQNACVTCEKALIGTYSFMPVFYESGYYIMANGVKDVQFHPGSGRVSFVYAKRGE